MLDDESSLAKEEARPQGDVKKEISALEEEADLPIEEVIRRMKERAEAEGEEDDDEEDEDSDDDGEEGEEGSDEEEEEEEGGAGPSSKKQKVDS